MSERRIGLDAPTQGETTAFYDRLTRGEESRGWWGVESRFDADKIVRSRSVARAFRARLRPELTPDMRVLDVGCGPGGFLAVLAELSGEVVGVDISEQFVSLARATIARHGLANASAEIASSDSLPCADGAFHAVVLVDVIHHLERIGPTLDEVCRVLRPGGRLLIFEPNKLNPLLGLMCALDRNEWGLLRLGSKRKYRQLLRSRFDIEHVGYSELLIGPDSRLFTSVAAWIASEPTARLLGWLSPKIFVSARRR